MPPRIFYRKKFSEILPEEVSSIILKPQEAALEGFSGVDSILQLEQEYIGLNFL
jgi:hypothetical protein